MYVNAVDDVTDEKWNNGWHEQSEVIVDSIHLLEDRRNESEMGFPVGLNQL